VADVVVLLVVVVVLGVVAGFLPVCCLSEVYHMSSIQWWSSMVKGLLDLWSVLHSCRIAFQDIAGHWISVLLNHMGCILLC
jgi:hypothetical protein